MVPPSNTMDSLDYEALVVRRRFKLEPDHFRGVLDLIIACIERHQVGFTTRVAF